MTQRPDIKKKTAPLYEGNGEEIRETGPRYAMHRQQVIIPERPANNIPSFREERKESGERHRSEYDEEDGYRIRPRAERNSTAHTRETGKKETVREPGQGPVMGPDTALRQENRRFNSAGAERVDPPTRLFDDFDSYGTLPGKQPIRKTKKKQPHRALWFVTILFCLAILTGMALLMLPQLLPGSEAPFIYLPNYAFVNGKVIRFDRETYEQYTKWRQYLNSDTIYYGITVDGVDVGGMTEDQAMEAVSAVSGLDGDEFDLSLTIGNKTWPISSKEIPVQRNTLEVVRQAQRMGKSNSRSIQGTDISPFEERRQNAERLNQEHVNLKTRPSYDHEKLREVTDGIADFVNRDPVNASVATFNFNTHAFTFTDDSPGAHVDPDELYEMVCDRLDAGDYEAELTVVPEKILAQKTKAELMNSFGLIASYTTKTTSNKNRNTNISLAAAAINGKTVLPGEQFSFNGATGERTTEKGYKEAAAISGGQSKDEVGGGVCQVSSTLFNAVARADLEILSRSPHAWPSNYVEKGMDATVNWPGLDFVFRNNTEWPVFIVAWYEDRKVTVEVYGMSLGNGITIDLESKVVREYPKPEGTNYVINPELKPGESKTTVTGRSGCMVETYQVWYVNGKEKDRKLLCKSTYRAYQETIEYNPR